MKYQEPSAKRKSDGGEAKYVHRLDMVSVSSIVSPIEKADNRENGVTQTPKPVRSLTESSDKLELTHGHIAAPNPISRQPLPPSSSHRPPRHNGSIHPGHPPSPLLLVMVRRRRPDTLLIQIEHTPQPPRLRTLFVLLSAGGPYSGRGV